MASPKYSAVRPWPFPLARHKELRARFGRLDQVQAAQLILDFDGIAQLLLERLERADPVRRFQVRAAAAADAAFGGVRADHGDGFEFAGIQRQERLVVFEQHDTLLGHLARQGLVFGGIDRPGRCGIIQLTRQENQFQHPAGGCVDHAFVHLPGAHGMFQQFAEPFGRAGHFDVEAGLDRWNRAVGGGPVRNHRPLKAPFLAQDARRAGIHSRPRKRH